MGNSMGGKRRAKVMKIDGSTVKVKPPATAGDVLRNHRGYVLLESEQVKQLGVRAQPLDPDLPLKRRKLYFLVELPRPTAEDARRVRSGMNVSAKDRLESLMLARRTASDISVARAPGDGDGGGAVRVRMRLPKAEVARLVEESSDPAEAAEKIMLLCVRGGGLEGRGAAPPGELRAMPGKAVSGTPVTAPGKKEKKTRFSPMEGEIVSIGG